MFRLTCWAFGCVLGALPASGSPGLIWPTPNTAFQEGRPLESFVQPTVSGRVESGLYGCVRNDGRRFHEGLDLFPIKRDSSNEALDPIFAILPGRVAYVSRTASHSSYGRYVVVEHDGEAPAFHTLYAHLATVDRSIRPGVRVDAGTVLGIMGRSAGGYSIPRSRAHLHLEIGFRLTDAFQTWYDDQDFGSQNRHGVWNGMNLVGIDPLAFYRAIQRGEARNLREHLERLPVAARVRVHTVQVPDFVRNYPALVTRSYADRELVAWDIAFTEFGVPKEWTPRFADEGLDGQRGDVRVLTYNPGILETQSCRRVLDMNGRVPQISSGTLTRLRKLFGFQ